MMPRVRFDADKCVYVDDVEVTSVRRLQVDADHEHATVTLDILAVEGMTLDLDADVIVHMRILNEPGRRTRVVRTVKGDRVIYRAERDEEPTR